MHRILVSLLSILLLLFLIFVAQNLEQVEVDFLFWTLSAHRGVLLFSTLGAGIVMGMFMHRYLEVRMRDRRAARHSNMVHDAD